MLFQVQKCGVGSEKSALRAVGPLVWLRLRVSSGWGSEIVKVSTVRAVTDHANRESPGQEEVNKPVQEMAGLLQ